MELSASDPAQIDSNALQLDSIDGSGADAAKGAVHDEPFGMPKDVQGLMPMPDLPIPNVTMDGLVPSFGNMAPLIDVVKKMDRTLELFREHNLQGILSEWATNLSHLIADNLDEFETKATEIASSSATTPSEAGFKAAQIMQLYEQAERRTEVLINETTEPLESHYKIIDLNQMLDPRIWLGLLEPIFNHTTPKMQCIDGHANQTLTEMAEDDCQKFGTLLEHLSVMRKNDKAVLEYFRTLYNHSSEILIRGPIVMQAPDLVPAFQEWATVAGRATDLMGNKHAEAVDTAITLSMRLLNDVGNCGINEEVIARGAAAAVRPLALPLAMLVAVLAWAGLER
uniref:Uncharacterized protein n=1 Tax=Alexandrium catenella TaxID=2925 RepID=A0A7S1VZ41_ALECA